MKPGPAGPPYRVLTLIARGPASLVGIVGPHTLGKGAGA